MIWKGGTARHDLHELWHRDSFCNALLFVTHFVCAVVVKLLVGFGWDVKLHNKVFKLQRVYFYDFTC